MQFDYKVIDEQQKLAKGTIEAADYEAARRTVFDNQWQLISLTEVKGISSRLTMAIKGKVKLSAISAFCSQMAMMIRSGANLVRGLELLQSQMDDRRLKEVVGIIFRSVGRGSSLSQAMRDTEGALPDLLINLVEVGEESGTLDSVLTSMSEYYERENFIRKKISSAAVYPVILTVVLVGLIIFFMGFIMPEMMDMLTENGQSLPMITQVVVNAATFIQTRGWVLGIGLAAIVFGFTRLIKIPRFKYFFHVFLLKLPLFGRNRADVIIARFSRTLALFLHSSIPIVPILNSLENIVGNEVPKRAVARARERVLRGESIALAFGQEPFFDPLVIQMMSIGEETGRLEELMREVANNYDKRVEIGIARLVSLVEPVFTIVIGAVAGTLIISIALPIFNMSSAVK